MPPLSVELSDRRGTFRLPITGISMLSLQFRPYLLVCRCFLQSDIGIVCSDLSAIIQLEGQAIIISSWPNLSGELAVNGPEIKTVLGQLAMCVCNISGLFTRQTMSHMFVGLYIKTVPGQKNDSKWKEIKSEGLSNEKVRLFHFI